MSLESLKSETEESLRRKGKELRCCRCKSSNYLTRESPARVVESANGFEIEVLKELDNDEQEQAEAHELGHLLLRCRGLISFSPENDSEGFFRLELNNAISHKFLVAILRDEFNIGSEVHLQLRKDSLASIEEEIRDLSDDPPVLHGLGLRLFDIEETTDVSREEVDRISHANNHVREALSAARRYLSSVTPETEFKIQLDQCKSLLASLSSNRQDLEGHLIII